ncbi:hypothetical protein BDK51DRAFT_31215 [Blyttiomyces helicus]|uniref:Uncharacterized protein n=1 Tax=Blyttiomyces helicus TaxID=388810 RepID=A0A4P9W155_9FUNG|nr:hypothetical protein BDK51DRAFT_31215 [Blyttiomyces helicus]|eukprot:RKO84428.1 hypothetical protein BDK51DRAFT_31215 [Blyttiomyces helicus]
MSARFWTAQRSSSRMRRSFSRMGCAGLPPHNRDALPAMAASAGPAYEELQPRHLRLLAPFPPFFHHLANSMTKRCLTVVYSTWKCSNSNVASSCSANPSLSLSLHAPGPHWTLFTWVRRWGRQRAKGGVEKGGEGRTRSAKARLARAEARSEASSAQLMVDGVVLMRVTSGKNSNRVAGAGSSSRLPGL